MSTLTKVLEEARTLQLRDGVTAREALALTMAAQRRTSRMAAAIHQHGCRVPLQIQMPAASSQDALLPRDREPTIEEIREAWKKCTEQSSLNGQTEHDEAGAAESAASFPADR